MIIFEEVRKSFEDCKLIERSWNACSTGGNMYFKKDTAARSFLRAVVPLEFIFVTIFIWKELRNIFFISNIRRVWQTHQLLKSIGERRVAIIRAKILVSLCVYMPYRSAVSVVRRNIPRDIPESKRDTLWLIPRWIFPQSGPKVEFNFSGTDVVKWACQDNGRYSFVSRYRNLSPRPYAPPRHFAAPTR